MKAPIKAGGPAFPVVRAIVPQPGHFTTVPESMPGMSLRDWFAGQAMIAAGTGNEPVYERRDYKASWSLLNAMRLHHDDWTKKEIARINKALKKT